jgi:putative transposase
MAVPGSVDAQVFLREQLETASPDLLRSMVKTFAEALMSAEADAICGAPYGERSDERTNQRNGYRAREWDTRAGTVELAIPKLVVGPFRNGVIERRGKWTLTYDHSFGGDTGALQSKLDLNPPP